MISNIMRIGIIAEYNPFHNGHIYQINEIKRIWPESKIIVLMSGKYVQRGEIAIASFEQRKEIALLNGVDELYEIPFEFATQAAHIFASGAVNEINKYNIDVLVFGSETNDINLFYSVANTIKNNEEKYYKLIRQKMKEGLSFPKASQLSLESLSNKSFTLPNDILGLEYVKAIVNNNLDIKAYCIKRTINFHSDETKDNLASASHIRKLVFDNDESYKKYTPMRFNQRPERIEDHYNEFKDIIIKTSAEDLKKIKLMSEGMENLFKKNIDASTYEEFVNRTNSKRYTSSRIKRVMLYVLLNITND